jgi:DNA-directed RNA polymerase II subunit RPB1
MSGRAIKCIRSRIKSKEGRVRGNLMGKRVDFSARTVITPDPILQLDQLGVPEMIAMNLTVPEYVTCSNKEIMRQLVKNGPNKWPGAKHIRRSDGKLIDLDYQKSHTDAVLDVGYIVERHLRDGDYVIFNRQPSLHKMSLMGHRVKVLPFQTFRLNLAVTSPYNADFDGDEMNMHVPQSYETMAEIKEIMAVPRQIIAPKDNKPVMGIVQDSLLGVMLLTTRDTFLELDQVMNLLMWFDFEKKKNVRDGRLPPPAIVKPRPLWTGKQILSLVFPAVNYARKENSKTWACAEDTNVYIKHGELLCGVMKKDQVGAKAGGVVHLCQRDLGPEETKIFLSDAQNLVNNWLVHNGFSVGVADIVSKPSTVH